MYNTDTSHCVKEASVEPIVSMLQETGQHVAQQRTALVSRARDTGRELVRFVQSEARRWKRYARARSERLTNGVLEVRDSLAPKAIERQLLEGVDEALVAIETRVRGRLKRLGSPRAK